ncbi:alanine racemase, partial [Chromobacterium piscinae]
PFNVWLMLDSGMHREGFLPENYHQAWHRLEASGKTGGITKMTHFARADEP